MSSGLFSAANRINQLMKEDGIESSEIPELGELLATAIPKILHYIEFLREKLKKDHKDEN